MYVLICYLPESHLESVKSALFAAGAGSMGGYDQCSWQTKGLGQFRPSAESNPFLGEREELAQVVEWRLELVVKEEDASSVIEALKRSHPYEVPSYHLIPVRV
ncbi:MAG TPA: NGG1p interacting factor NIF3 [Sphaerochaeta sp.]|nr:NGG1p interacting factor NIF3 [Sphaerochaeta sp.]